MRGFQPLLAFPCDKSPISRFLLVAGHTRSIGGGCGEGELRHRISYVAVDETEFDLNLHSADAGVMSDRGMSHVMMIHACVLSRLGDGSSRTDDVVVAPVVLGDITGRTLLSAIQKRCPWISKDVRSEWHVIILGSDSAKSLLLVAKHFKALTGSMPRAIFLHGRCFMHKLWGAFSKMMTMMSVINPMFSATCLTHRTGTMVKVRAAVKAVVSETLRVHFEPFPARHMERNKAIIKLVNAAEGEWARSEVDATHEHSLPKRVQARQELLMSETCCGAGHGITQTNIHHPLISLQDSHHILHTSQC